MDVRELGFDPARLGRIASNVEAAVAAEQYDGAVVLVARRGEVVLHEAIGFSERSSGRPAQIDDVFHLFSITKTFTAAAVLQCVDDGRLQLTS
jgi:CubicO group peptidase (beta-lactamase class C family)